MKSRRLRWGAGVWCVVVMAGACGKKGPPLPPLRPVPVAPTEVAARRVDQRVQLRMLAPKASQDPTVPLSMSRLEIYARTVPDGGVTPTPAQLITKENLVGTVEMRPPVDPAAPPPATPPATPAPVDTRPAPGDLVVWSEEVPAGVGRPLSDLTRDQQMAMAARRPVPLLLPPSGLRTMASRVVPPTRFYIVVGVSDHGRRGTPSAIVPVRFVPPPAAPVLAVPTHTETTVTLTWTTPVPGPVVIYSASQAGVEDPTALTPTPVSTLSWTAPVEFGVERCFTARRVQRDGPVSIESAAGGPVCVTPTDTFPPATPGEPRGVPEPGRITIEWDAVASADVAGYLVLRGDGTGDRLQQLTATPVAEARYVDSTTQAGTSYVYAIVAVDKAGNRSAESVRVTVIGR